jgi:hypothetical protein
LRRRLSRFGEDAGAELLVETIVGVDDGRRGAARWNRSDAFVRRAALAPGDRAVAGIEGATTWPEGDA